MLVRGLTNEQSWRSYHAGFRPCSRQPSERPRDNGEIVQYMLIMSEEESARATQEGGDCGKPDSDAAKTLQLWLEEMGRRGVLGLGERLESVSTATTIRVRDGETLVADGPFGETKEHIAGFHLINCANLDEAIEIASTHPCTVYGGVIEIRPVFVWT
jgi:hypothetical protein